MQKLTPHSSNPVSSKTVFVDWKKTDHHLDIIFIVKQSDLHVNPEFSTENFQNVGLWDFDVVEVFLQGKSVHGHYLELQISPLGQKFALLIKVPRKETQVVASLRSQFTSMRSEDGFQATLSIDAADIPGDFTELRGNFTACLGTYAKREYFALNINPEAKADFHRPELFVDIT